MAAHTPIVCVTDIASPFAGRGRKAPHEVTGTASAGPSNAAYTDLETIEYLGGGANLVPRGTRAWWIEQSRALLADRGAAPVQGP